MGHEDRRSKSEPANAPGTRLGGTPLEGRSADDAAPLAPSLGDMTMSRRRLIRRAAVAGTVAWVAPVITTIRPAAAQTLSRPPDPKSRATGGRSAETSVSKSVGGAAAGGSAARAPLARTGADIAELAALGGMSGALGTAAVLWSRRDRPEPEPDAEGGAPVDARQNRDTAVKDPADEPPGAPDTAI